MGKGFKHGISVFGDSGDGSTGYIKVICCESQEKLPVNADEYTIAVISDIDVNGYRITTNDIGMGRYGVAYPIAVGNEPEGHVLITIGNMCHSDYDVLIGGMEFCPITAYQAITIGDKIAYAPKTAFIYSYGMWRNWFTYLYGGDYVKVSGSTLNETNPNGIQHPYLTGGWVGSKDDTDYSSLGACKLEDGIVISSTKTSAIYAHTVNPIDLTNVKTIYALVSDVAGSPFLSIHKEGNSFHANGRTEEVIFDNTGVFTLDVRKWTGNYYIAIGAYGAANSCTVDEVYIQYGDQN